MKKIEVQGDTLMQRVRMEQRKASDELKAKIEKIEKQILTITEQLKPSAKEEN
jgi:chaperonin cofactor prefoldin